MPALFENDDELLCVENETLPFTGTAFNRVFFSEEDNCAVTTDLWTLPEEVPTGSMACPIESVEIVNGVIV